MTKLDPDALAELEREQAFLLRSLDDLDAEHRAGDLDQTDHAQLSDDYTRRLAEVTRAIDEERTAFAEVDRSLSGRQRILTIAGVLIVAVLAGVLLGRASGFRSPNDTLSGDIRQSSTGLLAEADVLTREGRWEEALGIYDEVLEIAPANTEALTYRGWLTFQLGEGDALGDLDEAVAIDPAYPDARVFRAIVLDRNQRFGDAAQDLAALDDLDAPPEILGLVNGSGLRASVAAGQVAQLFGEPGTPIDLDQVQAGTDDLARGGNVLLEVGDIELALRLFDAVIERDPDNVDALAASGSLRTDPEVIAVSPETGQDGLVRLDKAIELEPDNDQVRLLRARALLAFEDLDAAQADLDAIDVARLPDEAVELYDLLVEAVAG